MTISYPTLRFFVGGEWTADGAAPEYQDVIDPAKGSLVAHLPQATLHTVAAALAGARQGQAAWRELGPARRADVIERAAQLLRERVDEVAAISAREVGTPFREAHNYVLRAADLLDWDAGEGQRLYGRVIPAEPGLRQTVIPEPVGIVAAFTPWNAAVLTPCRKIGSALAAGCAIIVKAAEEAPGSAMAVVQAFADAGAPPGVIGLLFGNPDLVSRALIAAPEVRMVTFTGSVPIGKHLAALAGAEMKPILMELGGHGPVIVCEDADVQAAAARCAAAKFRNGGQICVAPTRFFLHEAIEQEFTEAFRARVRTLVPGDPLALGTTFGPLASARRLAAIEALVDDAVARGASLLEGGCRLGEAGFFYAPTVLARLPPAAKVLHDEPFGPVACLGRYCDGDDVVAWANALPYGLAGYIFTRDAQRAEQLSRALDCGVVAINHLALSAPGVPFGGVKDSGYGREGGSEGVRSYTVSKTISHRLD